MGINYSPKIVTNGLVLCLDAANSLSYPGSGTVWTDLSGNGNNGTLTNGPTYSSANRGSIVFDGSNDFISIPASTNFNFGSNNFVIEGWFYPTNLSGVDKCLVELRGSGSSSDGWVWFLNSSNVMHIYDNGLKTQSTTVIAINSWYYLCITRISGTLNYYVNGNIAGTASYATSTNASSTGLRISTRQDTTNSFTGRISNLRIYNNRALTASEVLQNYNATKGRFNL